MRRRDWKGISTTLDKSSNKKGAGSCPTPYLNSRKFDALVISKIKEHILTVENLTRLVNLVNEEMDTASVSYKDEYNTILCELDETRRKLGKLYDAIENNLDISYSDLAPRIHELREQQDKLEQRKAELEDTISHRKIELASKEAVRKYVEDLHDFLNESALVERKVFIKSFVREITVGDGEAKIVYSLPLTQEGLEQEKLEVLPIVRQSGPWGTVPELLFEKKHLIPAVQQLLISIDSKNDAELIIFDSIT